MNLTLENARSYSPVERSIWKCVGSKENRRVHRTAFLATKSLPPKICNRNDRFDAPFIESEYGGSVRARS